MNFFFLHGSRTLISNFLPPLFVLQRYVIYFNLPKLFLFFFVLGAGVEPARANAHRILSPACLPVPPSEQNFTNMSKNLLCLFYKDMYNFLFTQYPENKNPTSFGDGIQILLYNNLSHHLHTESILSYCQSS